MYRAIDEHGQVVEVLFQEHRDTTAATAFFRSALENTGVTPYTVNTDKAAAYPPALAAVLPDVQPITGKAEQQRIERDHQHLKGRLRVSRGCKTTAGAQRFCPARGFLRNLRQGFPPARGRATGCERCYRSITGSSLGGTHGPIVGGLI